MTGHTLDICIPTYNRIDQLQCTLTEIIKVILRENLMDKVRVLVSNNGSSDGTREFLEGLSLEEYPFVKIFHQKENIGFSANLMFLWKASSARYVWCVSDDDFYSNRLIVQILEGISSNLHLNPTIVINSFHFTGRGGDQNIVAENLLDMKSSESLIRYDAGLKDIVNSCNFTAFGLLGSLVFSRKLIIPFFDMPELIKSNYPHQLLLFKWLYSYPVIVLNDPRALGWRAEDSHWSLVHTDKSFQAHFLDYIYILDCALEYLSEGTRKSIYKIIYRNAFWAIIHYMNHYQLGIKWVLQSIFSKHICYRVCIPKLDVLLLVFACIKINKFRDVVKNLASRP